MFLAAQNTILQNARSFILKRLSSNFRLSIARFVVVFLHLQYFSL